MRAKRVVIVKELTETNFGDLMTKHLAEEKMIKLLRGAGFEFREGRAPGAPELADGAVQQRIAALRIAMVLLGRGRA